MKRRASETTSTAPAKRARGPAPTADGFVHFPDLFPELKCMVLARVPYFRTRIVCMGVSHAFHQFYTRLWRRPRDWSRWLCFGVRRRTYTNGRILWASIQFVHLYEKEDGIRVIDPLAGAWVLYTSRSQWDFAIVQPGQNTYNYIFKFLQREARPWRAPHTLFINQLNNVRVSRYPGLNADPHVQYAQWFLPAGSWQLHSTDGREVHLHDPKHGRHTDYLGPTAFLAETIPKRARACRRDGLSEWLDYAQTYNAALLWRIVDYPFFAMLVERYVSETNTV